MSKIVAIGLNYRLHAEEAGAPIPKEPIFFMKAISSICGPNDDVMIPKGSVKTDYEVELGIVIGTKASYIAVHDAPKHIAGYCVVNDVSEREFQIERGGQWTKGKSADTFCPMGPWLVTADEVPDPGAAAAVDRGQRRAPAGQQHLGPDLRDRPYRQLCQPLHDADAGRRDPDRHAVGGRARLQAAAFPEARATRMRLSVEGLGVQEQRLVAFG